MKIHVQIQQSFLFFLPSTVCSIFHCMIRVSLVPRPFFLFYNGWGKVVKEKIGLGMRLDIKESVQGACNCVSAGQEGLLEWG